MLKTLLKFLFAGSLLYWLISSGKLDLSLIGKSIHHGPEWIFAILLIIAQIFFGILRYKSLIEIKSKINFSIFQIAMTNWIGLFFSSILPGAVTGDLIKLIYIKKHDQTLNKTFLITSALLDRILGLTGLLFLSGMFSLIYFNEITKVSPNIAHIVYINFLLFAGSVFFFFLLFSKHKIQKMLLHIIFKIPLIGHKVVSIFEQIFALGEHKKVFFKCFLLSVCSQFFNIIAFWVVSSPFYPGHLPLPYAFTFIPIGQIAVAIPISPAGLGVGHALFQNLFSLVNINNGASLFNLFFLCNLSVNLFGIIPYLLAGKTADASNLEKEFNEIN